MESSSGGNYARSHRITAVMMGYVRLDHSFTSHPKIEPLGVLPRLLYVVSITYSSRKRSNGVISEQSMPYLAADCGTTLNKMKAAVAELVKQGLWERTEGGYLVHNYLKYQRSSDQIEHGVGRSKSIPSSNATPPAEDQSKIRSRSSRDQSKIKSRSSQDQDSKPPEIQQESTPHARAIKEEEEEEEEEQVTVKEKKKEKECVSVEGSVPNVNVRKSNKPKETEQQELPIPTETADSPTIIELGPNGFPINETYELIKSYCDAAGIDSDALNKTDKGRYMKVAKRLKESGITRADVTALYHWLATNPFYKSTGIDFPTLEKNHVKWLQLGQPTVFFQFTNGRESRDQKLKAQHDELFRIANGELICDDTPGNSEDFVDVHSHLVQ